LNKATVTLYVVITGQHKIGFAGELCGNIAEDPWWRADDA